MPTASLIAELSRLECGPGLLAISQPETLHHDLLGGSHGIVPFKRGKLPTQERQKWERRLDMARANGQNDDFPNMNTKKLLADACRTSFTLMIFAFMASCSSGGIPSEHRSEVASLMPQAQAGNSKAAFEIGKIYNKSFRCDTGVAPVIPILIQGAKFNTPEAKTDQYAASCVTELIHAYDNMAYALVYDEGRVSEAQDYINKSKQLWVYLHKLGYYGNLESLKWYLDQEDEAFADVCSRAQRSQAMDRASNAALLQQAAAGLSSSLQLAATSGARATTNTYNTPMVQTKKPSTPIPEYHGDGSQRSIYEHTAATHDWAAAEYVKQGKLKNAQMERQQAAHARQQAAELNSKTPVFRP